MNVGYIYLDDGFPESGDYANNFLCYDQDAPGAYEEVVAQARAQLHLEDLSSPAAQHAGTVGSWRRNHSMSVI